jgi:hypothetical protein
MSKTCTKCQQTKEDDAFNKDSRSIDGLAWWCKDCSRAQSKKYRSEHLEERRAVERARRTDTDRERARNYYHEHRKEYKAYITAHPEVHRRSALKTFYKLTMEEYDKMLIEQDGKCAICETPQEELKKPLVVDHDHNTGAVRGLLCPNCNHGLGRFKDSLDTVRKAVLYLEQGEVRNIIAATAAAEKAKEVVPVEVKQEQPIKEVKDDKPKYTAID